MNRVLVAADSSTDRRLLVALLESDPDFMVIAETDNGVEAVDLTVRLEPDLVAMDLDMPLMNGIEATRAIMERCPTRIVILSANETGQDLGRGADALKAGALTVVPRPDHPNSSQFNTRREMFLEMVRTASRKVPGLGKDPRYQERPERGERRETVDPTFGTTWLRPALHFTSPFDSQELPGDTTPDGDIRIFGLPFTVEDRAERLRRLLDEIADEGGSEF